MKYNFITSKYNWSSFSLGSAITYISSLLTKNIQTHHDELHICSWSDKK